MEENTISANSINVSTIRRFDPEIQNLVITASHVVLYTFDIKKSIWNKCDIDGVFFIYFSSGDHNCKVFILNRLSMKNFIQPLHSKVEIQFFEPFIVYRNNVDIIYGIWFYDKNEYHKVKHVLQILQKTSLFKINVYQYNELTDCVKKLKAYTENSLQENQNKLNSASENVRLFFENVGEIVKSQPNYINADEVRNIYKNSACSVTNIEMLQKLRIFRDSEIKVSGQNGEVLKQNVDALNHDVCNSNDGMQVLQGDMNQSEAVCSTNVTLPPNAIQVFTPEMLFSEARNLPNRYLHDVVNTDKQIKHVEYTFEPLSKQQLIDIIVQNLKNDAEFSNRLYEIYINSIRQ